LDQIDIDEDGDKTLSSIDINEQTPLPVVNKSKLVEISLQTPEPEMVTGVSPFISTPIEEEKKDEVVDIEKGEEVGRALTKKRPCTIALDVLCLSFLESYQLALFLLV